MPLWHIDRNSTISVREQFLLSKSLYFLMMEKQTVKAPGFTAVNFIKNVHYC
jgi:hypothetical protein